MVIDTLLFDRSRMNNGGGSAHSDASAGKRAQPTVQRLGQQSSTTVMAKCRHCSDRICPRCVMQIVENLQGVLRSPEPQGVQRYIEAIAEQRRRDASSINVQEPFALPSTIEELKRRLRLSPAEGFG